MSNDAKNPDSDPNDKTAHGFNLNLAYSLLALAIVLAIAIALFIVLPFYHRH